MNTIPQKPTRQHRLAHEAVEYAESAYAGLPVSARRDAALSRVALWSIGSEAGIIGSDQSVGFVVRIATTFVTKHYEENNQ